MTSELLASYLDRCCEIFAAEGVRKRCCALATRLCDELDLDQVDFRNPLSMFLEAALSRAFMAAYNDEDYRLALRFAEAAGQVAERIGRHEVAVARSENNRALALMELGQFVAADALFRRALDRMRDIEDSFDLKGTISANLAAMTAMRSDSGISRSEVPTTGGIRYALRPESRNQEALEALSRGRVAEAAEIFRSLAAAPGLEASTRAVLLSNLADAQRQSGQIGAARSTLEAAIAQCEQDNYDGQGLAGLLYAHAAILSHSAADVDRQETIIDNLKRAWDIARRVAVHSRLSLLVLGMLAQRRLVQGDLLRARSIAERAIEIYDAMRASTGRTEEELAGLFVIIRQVVELRLFIAVHEQAPLEVAALMQRAKARYWAEALGSRAPSAAEQRTAPQRLAAQDLGNLVGFGGTLFEFFVGPNATFLIAVHNRQIGAHRIDIGEQGLCERIAGFEQDLASGLNVRDRIDELSELLFGAVDVTWPDDRVVVICPDGPLWRFPLHLLRLPSRPQALGDEAPCFSVPSVDVLQQIRNRPFQPRFRHALVVACDGGSSPEERLADPGEEIAFVRAAFEATGTTQVLGSRHGVDGPATPERVLQRLPGATHIHFLAHADGGSDTREAGIVLEGGGEAGRLTASQVQALTLQADLVVLAVCESSLGRASPGEGLASLGRAFLLAGARCVVATLWEVPDGNIREFFRTFYAALAGQSPARAYWSARRAYETRHGRDRTFAALVMIGDGDTEGERFDMNHLARPDP